MSDKPKTAKQILQDAITEVAAKLPPHRIAILEIQKEFEEINATDDYEISLEAIVNWAGEAGITVAELHQVLPDPEILKKARGNLVKSGKIIDVKEGQTFRLKLVTIAAQVKAA